MSLKCWLIKDWCWLINHWCYYSFIVRIIELGFGSKLPIWIKYMKEILQRRSHSPSCLFPRTLNAYSGFACAKTTSLSRQISYWPWRRNYSTLNMTCSGSSLGRFWQSPVAACWDNIISMEGGLFPNTSPRSDKGTWW